MSNEMKELQVSSWILPNQSITFRVFLHRFTFKIVLTCVLTLSKINLPIFPGSIFAALISRHFGLFSKFSLWSLREIQALRFFMHSIRLTIERLSAMCFSIFSSLSPHLYTLKTSGLNLTQIGSNRNPDPGQHRYATDANRVKLTRAPGSTFLTQNSGSVFYPE